MNQKFEVYYEATPNPNSMKFCVACAEPLVQETVFFDNPTLAARSPLAQKLFGFPWTQAVFIGPDFVTITKQDWVEWSVLADPLTNLLAEHFERGEGVLLSEQDLSTSGAANFARASQNENGNGSDERNQPREGDSPTVRKIKEILNREIRPAVAMDGGDIVFSRYEDQRLYVSMQGACSGCPSSMVTLKDGIESRLKSEIPELIEVVNEG